MSLSQSHVNGLVNIYAASLALFFLSISHKLHDLSAKKVTDILPSGGAQAQLFGTVQTEVTLMVNDLG